MAGPNELMPHFSDREITRILQRAAELQERDRERGVSCSDLVAGLSLDELKVIAPEVGIDPRYIEAALAERASLEAKGSRFYFWGAPAASEIERIVPGELSPSEWETLVEQMRRATGRVGEAGTLGQSLEWTSERHHLSVRPKGGRTRVQVRSRHDELLLLAYLPPSLAGFLLTCWITLGSGFTPATASVLSVAAIGATYGLARGVAAALFRHHRGKMKALLQELSDHVTRTAPHVSPGVRSEAKGISVEELTVER
jgi:hypothetical protein